MKDEGERNEAGGEERAWNQLPAKVSKCPRGGGSQEGNKRILPCPARLNSEGISHRQRRFIFTV